MTHNHPRTRPVSLYLVACLTVVTAICTTSCGRNVKSTGESKKTEAPAEQPSAQDVIKTLVVGTVDAAKCRDLVKELNAYLGKDDKARQDVDALKLNEAQKKLLAGPFGLTPREIEQVEAARFSELDVQYLEWTFRLRDVAQSLRVDKLPPLQRAGRALAWVSRQVAPDESDEGLVAQSYVLLRGSGSAQERALVFLDLIRQLDLDGGLVACPAGEGDKAKVWLVGVTVADGKDREAYLFDPRLGRPIPGPDGKGVATLAQFRKQPDLLKQLSAGKEYAYDVRPEQAAKAEVLPACLYSALAPRMRFVEKQMSKLGHIRLGLDPARMVKRLEEAGPVGSWPQPEKADNLTPTPPRLLALLVPAEVGGSATGLQYARFHEQFFSRLYDTASVKDGYRTLGIWSALPVTVQNLLLKFSRDLTNKYITVPHDRLTRGRLENALGPVSWMEKFLKKVTQEWPTREELSEPISNWRERVEAAYAQPDSAETRQKILVLWGEDALMRYLLAPAGDDEEVPQDRKILSYVVLNGCAETLDKNAKYLLSLYWLERAEQSVNEINRMLGTKTPIPKQRVEQMKGDWKNAESWIQRYVEDYGVSAGGASLPARLETLRQRWDRSNEPDGAILLEFARDLHRGLALRLHLVDLLQRNSRGQQAGAEAKQLAEDVKLLLASADIKETLEKMKERMMKPKFQARQKENLAALQQVSRSLEPGGSVAWIGHAAALRAAAKKE